MTLDLDTRRRSQRESGWASSSGMFAMGTDWQTPPEQKPLGQALPQAPQCAGSVERSRQRSTAPQYSIPPAQSTSTHSPPLQAYGASPPPQTAPHRPQLK